MRQLGQAGNPKEMALGEVQTESWGLQLLGYFVWGFRGCGKRGLSGWHPWRPDADMMLKLSETTMAIIGAAATSGHVQGIPCPK